MATNSTPPAEGSARCEALLSSAPAAWWGTEPTIAVLSFFVWMNLFRSREVKESFAQRWLRPPYRFALSGAASIAIYWLGVALWVANVRAPEGVETGCVSGPASAFRLCIECASGLLGYDFIFFWLHLSMHVSPRIGHLLGHGRHHELDGSAEKAIESSFRTTHHSIVDGGLQVLSNILVQRYTPWGTAKTRLARWCHNVIITYMLVESHTSAPSPAIARRFFSGVRRHNIHHRTRGPPFQQFFGYLDHYVTPFFVANLKGPLKDRSG
ncbi:hypothetical protein AB1Y20_003241 [Prymnesium parvum]|uniref:Fatty acid hydroxylase domain-containing protein n=1 Tax=Prymnesium parvum TaxID=97485 RepID=A0AB34JDQ2_PRYPA